MGGWSSARVRRVLATTVGSTLTPSRDVFLRGAPADPLPPGAGSSSRCAPSIPDKWQLEIRFLESRWGRHLSCNFPRVVSLEPRVHGTCTRSPQA